MNIQTLTGGVHRGAPPSGSKEVDDEAQQRCDKAMKWSQCNQN